MRDDKKDTENDRFGRSNFKDKLTSELLTIQDIFEIKKLGLIVIPDFLVPQKGWKSCLEPIEIYTPNRERIITQALFNLTHFNLQNPQASINDRWRVSIIIKHKSKEEVPIGSTIFVRSEISKKLNGDSMVL